MRKGRGSVLVWKVAALVCAAVGVHAAAVADGSSVAPLLADDATSWQVLFDGKTLEGWTTTGGRYDGEARWSVEDGAIVGRTGPSGEGGLLYTTRSYTSYEIELDCRIDYPYDSGIFLRMLPPASGLKGVQVTLDHRPGGEIAALYADGFLVHNTEAEQHFAKGEWNRVRVRCTDFDPHVEVWINDQPVLDYRLPAGTPGFATRGLIGLQVHPADAEAATRAARFRGIRVRELDVFADVDRSGAIGAAGRGSAPLGVGPRGVSEPARGNVELGVRELTDVARAAGWRDLLARGLVAWQPIGAEDGYAIERGVLAIPADGGGHIVTNEDFRDFRLALDFKVAEMANSGLFLRGARNGSDPAYSGCEIQILDDFNWEARTNSKLAPYQFTGSLYAAVPAGPDKSYRAPGEWNRYEVMYRGTRLVAALNGRLLFDVDTSKLDVKPPFEQRASTGFIGLQRHSNSVEGDTAVWVRNLFVQSLEPLPSADAR